MPKIFISYRREDSKHAVGRLHTTLKRHVRNPKRDIFMDITNIPRGVDFVEYLDAQVAQCDVMLAVIGRDWLSARDPKAGGRRLDDPTDFVRIEIASALKRGIPVVPVVLDATPLPRVEELPGDLKPLARRNGERLEHESFDSDVERLIRNLPGKPKPAPRPAPIVDAVLNPRAVASKGNSAVWIAPVIALGLLVIGGSAWWAMTNGGAQSSPGEAGGGGHEVAGGGSLDVDTPLVAPAASSPVAETAPSVSLRDTPPPASPVEDVAAKPPALSALDDEYTVKAGAAVSFNPESNDGPASQKPLKIVEIDGKPVSVGQIVSLLGGHKVRLNASSLQFTAGGAAGQVNFSYTVKGKDGGVAQGQASVRVMPAATSAAPVPGLDAVATPPVTPSSRRAGETFSNCAGCPQMVMIPAGSFMMGSPAGEYDRSADERPQRRVTVPAFAAGKYEVTWEEYDRCVAAGSCAAAADQGFGKGSRPVINVSWDDAKMYVAWLNKVSRSSYRLLSEAEWEYAARAGTTTIFSFGNTISTSQANYNGSHPSGWGAKELFRKTTTPSFSFQPNAFGLHNMHGNVSEWVEDCYGPYSAEHPSNGAAFIEDPCLLRVIRGGSWYSLPQELRSATRDGGGVTGRGSTVGFRIARTL